VIFLSFWYLGFGRVLCLSLIPLMLVDSQTPETDPRIPRLSGIMKIATAHVFHAIPTFRRSSPSRWTFGGPTRGFNLEPGQVCLYLMPLLFFCGSQGFRQFIFFSTIIPSTTYLKVYSLSNPVGPAFSSHFHPQIIARFFPLLI